MKFELLKKVEFGHRRYYPRNKFSASMLRMLGRKSFTESQVKTFQDLGFTIEITEPVDEVFRA